MIDGRTYYRSLKIHKGQEPLLSGRIKQVDDEITALHFGLVPPARGTILFSKYGSFWPGSEISPICLLEDGVIQRKIRYQHL